MCEMAQTWRAVEDVRGGIGMMNGVYEDVNKIAGDGVGLDGLVCSPLASLFRVCVSAEATRV